MYVSCMYACIYVCMHVIYIGMYAFECMHACVCMHVCMYVYYVLMHVFEFIRNTSTVTNRS